MIITTTEIFTNVAERNFRAKLLRKRGFDVKSFVTKSKPKKFIMEIK